MESTDQKNHLLSLFEPLLLQGLLNEELHLLVKAFEKASFITKGLCAFVVFYVIILFIFLFYLYIYPPDLLESKVRVT